MLLSEIVNRGTVMLTLPLDFDMAVADEFSQDFVGLWIDPKVQSPYDPERITAWVCSPADHIRITDQVLVNFPNLRILTTASTGTNHIDLEACAARGIKVLSLLDDREGLNTISASAEWTFKLILEGLRLKRPYHELQGKFTGFVGYGRIGVKVLNWCREFGARGSSVYDPPRFGGVDPTATLPQVFQNNEIVVVCCALTDETRGMITYDLLRRLPPDAVLVNTARGEVINEADLCRFMAARPDVRVCLDVVAGEVDGTANPERLRQLGAYVSNHIAGETYESRTKAARIILELLKKETVTA